MVDETYYQSPRLKKAMDKLASFPLSFILGGTGYGKSQLVRHYLENVGANGFYFLATGRDLSAQFERFLTLLAEKDAPLASRLRVLGFPTDEWSYLHLFTLWKENRKPGEFFLCVDDAQALEKNPAFLFFLRSWAQEPLPGIHLFIVSREVPELPLTLWRFKKEVGCLEGKDLALSEAETGDFLFFRGLSLSKTLIHQIHEESEGWIAAIELISRGIKDSGVWVREDGIQALFKEAFSGGLKASDRLLLARIAPFDDFTLPFAVSALGNQEIVPLLEGLYSANAFVSKEDGSFRFHALFREFLLKECPDDEEEKRVYRRAGFYRLKKNDPSEPFLIEWFIKGEAVEELFKAMNEADTPRFEFLSSADLERTLAYLPKDAYRIYPYAYLHLLFLFFVWGGADGFPFARELYDAMENDYNDGEHKEIAAELALLKRLFFPDRVQGESEPLYRIAHDLYPAGTRLLRKEDPFTFGLPMLLESEYFVAGELDEDLKRLSDNAYERVCPGFGHGSEELAWAEAYLLQGQVDQVERWVKSSEEKAKKEGQSSLLVALLFTQMIAALYLGERSKAKALLSTMGDLVSFFASRKDVRAVSRSRLREQFWLSSSLYGAYTHENSAIPADVFRGDEKDYLLQDGLGVGKAVAAEVKYAFGDYAGAYATSVALLKERTISLLPRLRGMIIQGLALERLDGKDEGWNEIKEALLLGEKDRLILPFALEKDLAPFLERFAHLKGGDSAYRTRLFQASCYHQSVSLSPKSGPLPLLSKREKQLLGYLKEKKSRSEIARYLYISENTVKSELSALYQKLGVHSQEEALALYAEK